MSESRPDKGLDIGIFKNRITAYQLEAGEQHVTD